ncbi:MAG: hypothetical protein EA359_13545 [Balneolaceae bacterium]|nr:MAG: hypothetical protein EA359_13545 [Balneolaceae bacterium]
MKDIGFIMLNSSKNILLIALFTAAFVWSCSDSKPVNEFGDEDYGEVTFTISGDVEGSFSGSQVIGNFSFTVAGGEQETQQQSLATQAEREVFGKIS